jgi:hypothetical protein
MEARPWDLTSILVDIGPPGAFCHAEDPDRDTLPTGLNLP